MNKKIEELTFVSIEETREILLAHQNIVLTTHVNPDGDALGSEGALYLMLKELGKNVQIINNDSVPSYLEMLNTEVPFGTYDANRDDEIILNADIIIILDVNDSKRLGRMEDTVLRSQARKLVIDHHTNPKAFADFYHVSMDASATGEMVYDLRHDGQVMNKPLALQLYVAIVTDTGSFRFERTSPKVHRIAATLLETGLHIPVIHEQIYDSFKLSRTRLLGMVLKGIQPTCDGKATILTVTQEMFRSSSTKYEETEGIVNYGLSIEGVLATALITEREDCIKISFRSRGGVEINQIAQKFGGGGHIFAAGARITGMQLAEVQSAVEEAFCSIFG
jgi:bifunctional oligoribonuclease and PAP phosphatase NrnA